MKTNIDFLYNPLKAGYSEQAFGNVLCSHLSTSRNIMFAVAFVSEGGLSMIWKELETFLKSGGNAEIVLGLEGKVTEPAAIQRLYEGSLKYPELSLFGVPSIELNALYHPKMFFFTGLGKGTFIFGSSNLTVGGLKNNFETNLRLETDENSDIFWDAIDFYYVCFALANPIVLNDEYIRIYSDVYIEYQESRKELDEGFSKGSLKLAEYEATMVRKGKRSVRLSPWSELVLSKLPTGEFTNDDIYAYKHEFSEIFPDNRNIEAKIRQQLQVLRDLGIVEWKSDGNWSKK